MPSIFSRIASGDIPAITVYEDADTLAFLDISPASKGHTLVIAKAEYPDIYSIPPALLVAVGATVQRIAVALHAALQPDGLNILQNNGSAAGQTVFHYHVHLIPRWNGDQVVQPWRTLDMQQDELRAIAAQIRQHSARERS